MAFQIDARGAYRAGRRFKSTAQKLAQAEELAAATLARRIVPEFVRDALETHNIKAARVRESSGVRRDGNVVTLTGYHRGTGLLQFGAKASRATGVTVTVTHARGPAVLRHAFIALGLSDNKHVFERDLSRPKRVMQKGNYKGERRQPIKSIYGPSVAQILRNPARQERLRNFAQKILSSEIRRQLARL